MPTSTASMRSSIAVITEVGSSLNLATADDATWLALSVTIS